MHYRIFPGVTFGLLTILLMNWTSICCWWLDAILQPWSSVCARISPDLMINAGMLLASGGRLIFSGPVITIRLTGRACPLSRERQWNLLRGQTSFSNRNREVLMNAQSPQKWWSTLKSAVFGLSLEFVTATAYRWEWWTFMLVGC